MRVPYVLTAIVIAACSSSGGSPSMSPSPAPTISSSGIAPALDAITESDLRRDMFALGGDAMRGREAGTLDEMRATGWVAERAREAGLLPAGDDGTYFQWWPIRRSRLSENSQIAVGEKTLRLWKDAVVLNAPMATLDLPIVFVADTAQLTSANVRGKAVAMVLPSLATAPPAFACRSPKEQGSRQANRR